MADLTAFAAETSDASGQANLASVPDSSLVLVLLLMLICLFLAVGRLLRWFNYLRNRSKQSKENVVHLGISVAKMLKIENLYLIICFECSAAARIWQAVFLKGALSSE